MGQEPAITLNSDYGINHAFDITLLLLKGGNLRTVDLDVAENASRVVGTALQSVLSSGLFNTVNLFNGQQVTKTPGEADAAFAQRQRQQQQLQGLSAKSRQGDQ